MKSVIIYNVLIRWHNGGIVLHKTCYIYSYSTKIIIRVSISISTVSEFLWILAAEDESVCGVGDVSKV